MDQVTHYRQIAAEVIQWVVDIRTRAKADTRSLPIIDHERGQYALFVDGWRQGKRHYGSIVHIEVNDKGHCWLHYDGTDFEVGQQLLDRGVAREDLIQGWISPTRRALSGLPVGE